MKKIFAFMLFIFASFCSYLGAQIKAEETQPSTRIETVISIAQLVYTAPAIEMFEKRSAETDWLPICPNIIPTRSTKARLWNRKI